MDRHGQTIYMEGDPVRRRKNGLGGGGLLSLRLQSTERERKRGLILTSRKENKKSKYKLDVKGLKTRKYLDVNVQERGFHINTI